MKRSHPDTRRATARRLLCLALPLLLGAVGCQPVLTALGEGPAPQPSATPTWPPSSTATSTIAPPTVPAPPATSTATPTATRAQPRPTPTVIITATPEAGFYGDPAIGFSFFYPSEWEVDASGGRLRTWNPDIGAWAMGESSLMEAGESVDDFITELYKSISETDVADITADTTTTLWDGTQARVIEFAETEELNPARVTFVTRGQRVFLMFIFAPQQTFESYAHTLEAIPASMQVEEPRPYGISRQNALFMAGGQPDTIDPASSGGSAGGIIGAVFSGLVMLDENLQVVPDLAERWEVSDDGTVYTFHLRPDATFHDGKPVTAHDVKFSWERAADPATESDYVTTYLGDIVGLKAKFQGQADDISGLEVLDDHTLRVTIDAPKVYFLAKLTYPTAYVVDENNVKDEDWEHHPNGTGPFRLVTWEDDHLFILERYDGFYLEPAKLEHVVSLMYVDVPMWMYENEEIDLVGVGTDDIERVTDPSNPLHADLHSWAGLCTSRPVFDVTVPPFDDPLVRQAFAYAIDREKLAEVVLKGTAQPARCILPPAMPGHSREVTGPGFDPERARQLLADSTYAGADALPEITYTMSGMGGDLASIPSALIDMWRTHLGVEVTAEQLEPTSYIAEIHEHHGQIINLGWCADYPDPENFLDVLYHSESQENLGGYSNPEVDSLLEQARVEPDAEARLALYTHIEQMIMDDVPDLPLLHYHSYLLLKPYVKDYPLSPIGLALEWRITSLDRPQD